MKSPSARRGLEHKIWKTQRCPHCKGIGGGGQGWKIGRERPEMGSRQERTVTMYILERILKSYKSPVGSQGLQGRSIRGS